MLSARGDVVFDERTNSLIVRMPDKLGEIRIQSLSLIYRPTGDDRLAGGDRRVMISAAI